MERQSGVFPTSTGETSAMPTMRHQAAIGGSSVASRNARCAAASALAGTIFGRFQT